MSLLCDILSLVKRVSFKCRLNKNLSYRQESVHVTSLYRGLIEQKLTVLTNSDH